MHISFFICLLVCIYFIYAEAAPAVLNGQARKWVGPCQVVGVVRCGFNVIAVVIMQCMLIHV